VGELQHLAGVDLGAHEPKLKSEVAVANERPYHQSGKATRATTAIHNYVKSEYWRCKTCIKSCTDHYENKRTPKALKKIQN
jgi:hypothetical protein